MIEAYKIGFTIALTNQVSGVLAVISRDLAKSDADAKRLQATKSRHLVDESSQTGQGLAFLGSPPSPNQGNPLTDNGSPFRETHPSFWHGSC